MNTFEQTLGSGAAVRFPGGKSFLLLDTTGAVDITFFDQFSKPMESAKSMLSGYKVTFPEPFASVEIKDVSAASNTVKLGITSGNAEYARLDQGYLPASIVVADSLSSHPQVTVNDSSLTLIRPANTSRRSIIINSDKANPGDVVLGDSNITLTWGLPVGAGEDVILDNTGAIYAYHENGSACLFNILESNLT